MNAPGRTPDLSPAAETPPDALADPGVLADPGAAAADWLRRFEQALAGGEVGAIAALFLPDAHWRDVLGTAWTLNTVSGAPALASALAQLPPAGRPRAFACAQGRVAAQWVERVGERTIEALIAFETGAGPGEGVLRLRRDPGDGVLKGWTLLTALVEIRGHEERFRRPAVPAAASSRTFLGPNWLARREHDARYQDRDPAVLIVGAGQAGLSLAARLRQLEVDTLVVDRQARAGDNWRQRYSALVLHNQRQVNHLPYLPFPDTWPTYIPKDMLAAWFEHYVQAMEINLWCATGLEGARRDEAAGCWEARLRGPGGERVVRPRHLVLATGVSAIPDRSPIAGLEAFEGTVMHSADYRGPEGWAGRRVVVIGMGTSGHDVAQDLCEHGAHVTMVQRSPTMVQNVEPTAQLPYALYGSGRSLADCDLITMGTPMALYEASNRINLRVAAELDRELHQGLAAAGFRLDMGEDGTNWQMRYLTRGGGYYFNVGCSELIIAGRIGILPLADVAGFEARGLRLSDGRLHEADLIVTARGYLGPSAVVARLLGEAVARRVGPVWGVDARSQELANLWMPTPQPGLWFTAGSLAQCRIYSKVLALQLQARELGLAS
jgi:cation diffusion facilitator CzcD-associated flavoprotein CzcO